MDRQSGQKRVAVVDCVSFITIWAIQTHVCLPGVTYPGPGSQEGEEEPPLLNVREKKFGRKKVKKAKKSPLFFAFLTFLRPNLFLAHLDFSPAPLTAPGSPRMFGSIKDLKMALKLAVIGRSMQQVDCALT